MGETSGHVIWLSAVTIIARSDLGLLSLPDDSLFFLVLSTLFLSRLIKMFT